MANPGFRCGDDPQDRLLVFNYSTNRAQEVPTHLPDSYYGYLLSDDSRQLQRGRRACCSRASTLQLNARLAFD
ncbi:hypothetical protein EMIT0P218_130103 [Pseudomonas sp. IT-P218]